MILFLIASQDYILIPYQKDGKWGLADINGRVVVEPKYDGIGIYGYSQDVVSIPIIVSESENISNTGITGVAKLRYDPVYLAWTNYDENYTALESSFTSSDEGVEAKATMKTFPTFVSDYAKPIIEGPIWVLKDGKFGVVDISGREIVPPKYDEVFPFEKGRAWVKLNGKYGMIDKNGKEVIPIKYDAGVVSDEGIIWVKIDDKWGIMDTSGKEISPPLYDYEAVTPFTNGVAWILKDNKWGLVDGNGKTVIPPKFDGACPFVGEFSAVIIENKWGLIDKTGKEIIPIGKYEDIGISKNYEYFVYSWIIKNYGSLGYSWIIKNIKYYGSLGYLRIIKNTPCDDLEDLLREGLIAVKSDGKFGFVDKNGKEVIPPRYEEVMPFVRGISAVKRNGKWGFVDKRGKEIVSPTYEFAGYCYFIISEDESYWCIEGSDYDYLKLGYLPVVKKAGKYSTPFRGEYDFIVQIDSNLFLAKKGGGWGLIDEKNKEVLNFRYDKLFRLHKDLFVYSEKGKYGVISLRRGVIVQPKYNVIFYAGEGMIGLVLNNNAGFADTSGKMIFQPKYDYGDPWFINGFALMYNKGKPYLLSRDGKEVELKYSGSLINVGGGVLLHRPYGESKITDIINSINEELERVKNLKRIKTGILIDGISGEKVKEADILRHFAEKFPNIPELKEVKRLEDAINLLIQRKSALMKEIFYLRVLPDGRNIEFRG